MRCCRTALVLAILAVTAAWTPAATLNVGPGQTYSTVQAAVNAAAAGDTVQIWSSTYTQSAGWATINKANLTLIGVGSTRPILDANGSCLSGKGIFIVQSTGVTVQNLEFKNARNTTDKNADGIRVEAGGLTIRGCYFHDNDDGILTNNPMTGTLLVDSCEFNHNGYGDGQSHNMYIGQIDSFTLQYCWSHNAYVGHEVKTRAKVNYILYCRLGNEGGNGSYEFSAPQGGTTYLVGTQVQQSATSGNSTIIDYASESMANPDQHLYVVNCSVVNNRSAGTFVNNHSTTGALLENDIFQGNGTVLSGPGSQTTNWPTANAYFVDPTNYNYHLTAASTGAINMGTTPGTGINGFNMKPLYQYVHPCSYQTRTIVGNIDIGAFEY